MTAVGWEADGLQGEPVVMLRADLSCQPGSTALPKRCLPGEPEPVPASQVGEGHATSREGSRCTNKASGHWSAGMKATPETGLGV